MSTGRLYPLLKHAQLQLTELIGPALAPYGIDGRELAVLNAIADNASPSQQEVARGLGIDRTTMVAMVDALERKGLVKRNPHPADRRKNTVELTAAGRDIARAPRGQAWTRSAASSRRSATPTPSGSRRPSARSSPRRPPSGRPGTDAELDPVPRPDRFACREGLGAVRLGHDDDGGLPCPGGRPGPPGAAPPGPRPGPFPWTPARPTWTPPSGPACSRCSIAADLGRRDESP